MSMSKFATRAHYLKDLSDKATPGPWRADPKRLTVPIEGGLADGPIMSYLVGDRSTGEGKTVSLASERMADHHFVAALVNAFREGRLIERSDNVHDEDTKRLNWLFSAKNTPAIVQKIEDCYHSDPNRGTFRDAIDAAMRGETISHREEVKP